MDYKTTSVTIHVLLKQLLGIGPGLVSKWGLSKPLTSDSLTAYSKSRSIFSKISTNIRNFEGLNREYSQLKKFVPIRQISSLNTIGTDWPDLSTVSCNFKIIWLSVRCVHKLYSYRFILTKLIGEEILRTDTNFWTWLYIQDNIQSVLTISIQFFLMTAIQKSSKGKVYMWLLLMSDFNAWLEREQCSSTQVYLLHLQDNAHPHHHCLHKVLADHQWRSENSSRSLRVSLNSYISPRLALAFFLGVQFSP